MSKPSFTKARKYSNLAKIRFEKEIRGAREEDVQHVLRTIATIDTNAQKKADAKQATVVKRLTQSENDNKIKQRPRNYNRSATALKSHRRGSVSSPRPGTGASKVLPGAAQYRPNFQAVMTTSPALSFQRSEMNEKRSSPHNFSMGEMAFQWTNNLRTITFDRDLPYEESPLPPSVFDPKRFMEHSRGLLKGDSKRYSYLPMDETPAPTDYTIKEQITTKKGFAFDGQASRRERNVLGASTYYTNLAANIDATKPRMPQTIAFDKQAPRERKRQEEDQMWKQLEDEQREIINILYHKDIKKAKPKPKKEPFAMQTTTRNKHVFHESMHDDAPDPVSYNTQQSLRALDSPLPSFDISQPSFKGDRAILCKTSGHDVPYHNSDTQWEKTRPSTHAPNMATMAYRRSAYDYMPKTCGSGEYVDLYIEDDYPNVIDFERLPERETCIETPDTIKR